MTRIPLHDVVAQNKSIQLELNQVWADVYQSGQFVNGPRVQLFERAFAKYIGTEHCIGVGNATDGFEIAFQVLGLKAGDEIIVPANAHVSPALAALKMGLKPVFCDVSQNRMLLNADTVAEEVSEKTKAVVAVHLYGRACSMEEIEALCTENGLVLIEDFSQAQGASICRQKVGSFGDISVCSFYPTKPLGALGDGGAILTSDGELADMCRALANYGWTERDNVSHRGRNSRLDELQAAVLNVKLKYLDNWNSQRLLLAKQLQLELNQLDGIIVNEFQEGDVCHLFVLGSEKRDELKEFLNDNGVDCGVHYPVPIHQQNLFQSGKELPISERLCGQVLSVPVNEIVAKLIGEF